MSYHVADIAPQQQSIFYLEELKLLQLFQQQAQASIVSKKTPKGHRASLDIYVDTEYVQQPNKPNKMLTTQLCLHDGANVVLEHPMLQIGRLPSWDGHDTIFPTALGLQGAPYAPKNKNKLNIFIGMFFAPSDILAGLMLRPKAYKLQRELQQKGRITFPVGKWGLGDIETAVVFQGVVYNIFVTPDDSAKYFGIKGLAATAEALGIPMLAKDTMDSYKENMLVPYMSDELFPVYREYAVDDALVLSRFRQKKADVDATLFSVQGLEAPKTFSTPGSLVSKIQEGYLKKHCGDNGDAWEALSKDGKPWKIGDMTMHSSVKHLALQSGQAPLLALVQGGRAKNNIPGKCEYQGVVADIDAAGFYAVAQSLCPYPLGIPVVYNIDKDNNKQKRYTLGSFLESFGSQLVPRAFVIVVTGSLSFQQSLIHSKIATADKIRATFKPDEPDVDAPFLLLSREIHNGVVTSDVWDTLKHVCSNKELKEYKQLDVETAIFYPDGLRYTDATRWAEDVREHIGKHGQGLEYSIVKYGDVKDNSPRHWLDVSMLPFIKTNSDKRDALKKEMRTEKDAVKKQALNVLQDNIKLINNTSYGVQASAFFDVANVCFANNVTAMGRTCIWLASRTLGGYQDITDGFVYSLDNVLLKTAKKPSMETLTLRYRPEMLSYEARRSLSVGSLLKGDKRLDNNSDETRTLYLDGTPWETAGKEGWLKLDALAQKHLETYWKAKDGSLPTCLQMFKASHKDVFHGGGYRGQTDYVLVSDKDAQGTSGLYMKARGHKLGKDVYWDIVLPSEQDIENGEYVEDGGDVKHLVGSQMQMLFQDILGCPEAVRVPKAQQTTAVLKINDANKMAISAVNNVYKENEMLAGDTYVKNVKIKPISMSMFCYQTRAQHTAWAKANDKLIETTGYGLEQCFQNADGTFRYAEAIDVIDKAILENRKPTSLLRDVPLLPAFQRDDEDIIDVDIL